MKTIEEAARYFSTYAMEQHGFKAGVEFAQRWIPVEEELPEYSNQVLLKFSDGSIEAGYYLRHKHREDEFYSRFEPDIEFVLYGVVSWRPIELK